jgi:putative DNA methylase
VIFAQMVDDPSAHPDLFPTEKKQEKERQRLFRIIEDLVLWENTTNETVLQRARDEIWQSWRYTCAENADHPRARELFDRYQLPAFHDPFAGGGALPLEAQRLGLESHASDLNPVAVLINKAMIEIPPRFAGRPPVHPGGSVSGKSGKGPGGLFKREWQGAQGLAEDVHYYGQWMRDEAERRIGHLYPQIEGHGRDGRGSAQSSSGPEALLGLQAHRHRLALGAHGEEPQPSLCPCRCAARLKLLDLQQSWQRSICRAVD